MKQCSIEDCGGAVIAKGFCQKHYWRNHRHGSPHARPSNDGAPLDWLRLHIGWNGEDCLAWPFGHNQFGYGSVLFDGQIIGAHRAMCILSHGEPPTSAHQAAHSCGMGHKGCVNPKHLRWATPLENAGDRLIHRETNKRMGPAKLTMAQRAEIVGLRGAISQNQMAKRFGVDPATISRVLSRAGKSLAKSNEHA